MKRISVIESINKKRLVYPIDAEIVFSYIMMYFLSLVLPICTLLNVISDVQHNRDLVIPVYTFMALIDLWMLAGIFYTNKLYRLRGKPLAGYKNEIISILKNYYPATEFHFEDSGLIRGEKEIGWFKMRARIITIILADDSIYINILNTYALNKYGRICSEGFSPIQGVYNYFRSKVLAKYIYSNIQLTNK